MALELIEAKPNIVFEDREGNRTTTKLSGTYNFENIATALCLGKYFEVDMGMAKSSVANYVPDNNRSQIMQKGSNTILMDAYNANPTSMIAALENLGMLTAETKVAILGDMLELGEDSQEEHRQIGLLTSNMTLQKVIFCGPHMRAAAEANPNANYFASKDELDQYLRLNKIVESTILLKGSRGMGLETLLDYIG